MNFCCILSVSDYGSIIGMRGPKSSVSTDSRLFSESP